MKNILLAIGLLIGLNSFSQTSGNKMSKANIDLLQQLNEQEERRLERVNAFVNGNPDFKVTIKDSINIKQLYDVIDGKPLYKSTYNLQAGRATKTNQLQVGGSMGLNLEGTDLNVGVWDGGPVALAHPEFQGSQGGPSRITIVDIALVDGDSGTFSDHGTHVAGTIGANGTNPNALGMAPNVDIISYNWISDESEMVLAANDETDPIYLSNHSYGIPAEDVDAWFLGAYTVDARDIDNIARNNPFYLIVASAGNSGNFFYPQGLFPGLDKLTSDKNAKNNLVVANANPSVVESPPSSGNYELSNLVINPGSSQGPTDDIRIKPDIAADGTNLFSPVEGNGYAVFSGTSMSAPNTTGSLVLLQEYNEQLNGVYLKSATLKGLVCHTAIDDQIVVGPDPVFGWGFLDTKRSAEVLLESTNAQALVEELTLDQDEVYTYTFNAEQGDMLSASICWTDMPGDIVPNGTLNDQAPRLINDLDIRLSINESTFLPWRLDYSSSTGVTNSKGDNIRDNIERVDVEAPITGTYTLTVSHKGTLEGDTGNPFDPQSQDFSLILTGNNLTLGIEENFIADQFVIYPNPSSGVFNVGYNSSTIYDDAKVRVYDVSGRFVYDKILKAKASNFNEILDLSFLSSGIYIAEISVNNSSNSYKLVIE